MMDQNVDATSNETLDSEESEFRCEFKCEPEEEDDEQTNSRVRKTAKRTHVDEEETPTSENDVPNKRVPKKQKRAESGLKKECYVCNKIVSEVYVNYHMKMHTGIKPFKCNECGFTFDKISQLESHSVIHGREAHHKCKLCSASFSIKPNLQNHMAIHERMNEIESGIKKFTLPEIQMHQLRPHKCSECGIGFNKMKYLNQHLIIHNRDEHFKCNLCSASFSKKQDLGKHMLNHKMVTESRTKEDELKNKNPIKTTSNEPTKKPKTKRKTKYIPAKRWCNICEKWIYSSYNRHMKIHSDEKPFKCGKCDRTFKRKNNLDDHLVTHAYQVRYTCHVCLASFNKLNLFNDHMLKHGQLEDDEVVLLSD